MSVSLDLRIGWECKIKRIIYEVVGWTLKSNKEVELPYKFVLMLERIEAEICQFDREAMKGDIIGRLESSCAIL